MGGRVSDLIEFYGTECAPCKKIAELVERLQAEEGIVVERLEVWHNAKNQEIMMQFAKGRCMSVPFLYNKKTGEFICGDTDYERLKKWAGVKK